MSHTQAQLTPQFRQQETETLFNYALAGESATIVGISGAGKSNLFNHLFDAAVQRHYLGVQSENMLFVRVNFHYAVDFSTRSIYSLILEQLETLPHLTPAESQQLEEWHEAMLNAGHDGLKIQRYFKRALRTLLAQTERHLIFLFDQFAEAYHQADSRLFANLRGLREDYKYRLCYFVFTRQSLRQMALEDPSREEFYELLSAHTLGLAPYGRGDALHLLQRVSQRTQTPFNPETFDAFYTLTGGHGGLLRTTLLICHQHHIQPTDTLETIEKLLAHNPIQTEAHKIWQSLNTAEQRLLAYLAHDIKYDPDSEDSLRQLQLKGIVTPAEKIFSPLLAAFVRQQKAVWEQPLYFDPQTRRVLVYGKPTSKPLTPTELQIFTILYDRMGEAVRSDEITQTIWPGIEADQHLKTNIYRLRRKIEPDSKNPTFILGVHGFGYRLDAE